MTALSTNDTIILAAFIAVHVVAALAYFGGLAHMKRRQVARLAEFRAALEALPDAD